MTYEIEHASTFENGATGWIVTDAATGAVMPWCEWGLSILSGPIQVSEFMEVGSFHTKDDAKAAIAEAQEGWL